MNKDTEGFEAVVAQWLRSRGYDVASIVEVQGIGSDWSGDTERGFYETFSVEVAWLDSEGASRRRDVGGEDMQSLWGHVVGAWSR